MSIPIEDRLTVSGIVLTCQECSFQSTIDALATFSERAPRRSKREAKNGKKIGLKIDPFVNFLYSFFFCFEWFILSFEKIKGNIFLKFLPNLILLLKILSIVWSMVLQIFFFNTYFFIWKNGTTEIKKKKSLFLEGSIELWE